MEQIGLPGEAAEIRSSIPIAMPPPTANLQSEATKALLAELEAELKK
jgi:hypothetical protein